MSRTTRDGGNGGFRPLRIAFIGGRGVGSAYSGIERYYEEIGSRLAARGHEVTAYCRSHFSPPGDDYRGVRVRRIPTIRSKHLETLVHTLVSTADVCFRDVDVVQFHALGSSPFAWIPRLAGKRTVVSVRGLDWQRAKWGALARTYLRLCEWTSLNCPNATVVVSRTLQRHYRDRFRREVRYVPNGVNRIEARPDSEIARWGLRPRQYFLYAGRLSPEKRLDVLLQAHRAAGTGLPLVIAGGSSYSEEYMAQLRAGAGPDVVFTGFLTGNALEELFSNALAFVLPSTMEGLSVALLEAMAYGLPVVTSDIPENRELVDECGGYVATLGDAPALAAVLSRLAGDPEAARRL
ncbi:MAG TPA: glycosyltransferase family 4 protein, partial [Candidatus Polarisedimenticolia bacterium]|nr:glycosyltransferase family 4 protein [Candidatus Polarisedimenticolia bacterium]